MHMGLVGDGAARTVLTAMLKVVVIRVAKVGTHRPRLAVQQLLGNAAIGHAFVPLAFLGQGHSPHRRTLALGRPSRARAARLLVAAIVDEVRVAMGDGLSLWACAATELSE